MTQTDKDNLARKLSRKIQANGVTFNCWITQSTVLITFSKGNRNIKDVKEFFPGDANRQASIEYKNKQLLSEIRRAYTICNKRKLATLLVKSLERRWQIY